MPAKMTVPSFVLTIGEMHHAHLGCHPWLKMHLEHWWELLGLIQNMYENNQERCRCFTKPQRNISITSVSKSLKNKHTLKKTKNYEKGRQYDSPKWHNNTSILEWKVEEVNEILKGNSKEQSQNDWKTQRSTCIH